MCLSIRWRLTLWNTLALAVVLLAFGALVRGLLAHAHGRIDRSLQERAESALGRVNRSLLAELKSLKQDPEMAGDPDRRLRHWIYEFKEHENIGCVVYDGQ